MSSLSKEYIGQARTFFPMVQKPEREYLRELQLNIEDYCAETNTTTIEELYESFGTPCDVVHSYYESLDTDAVLKRLQSKKTFRILLTVLIISIIIGVCDYCAMLHYRNEVIKSNEEFFNEKVIK